MGCLYPASITAEYPRPRLRTSLLSPLRHGKTTLVDTLLQHRGSLLPSAHRDRVMDRNDLEKSAGSHSAKNCAVTSDGTHSNIVDTPGCGFGGGWSGLSIVDTCCCCRCGEPDAANAIFNA